MNQQRQQHGATDIKSSTLIQLGATPEDLFKNRRFSRSLKMRNAFNCHFNGHFYCSYLIKFSISIYGITFAW